MRFAFLGYGSIAAAHARALRELGGVEFDTVMGPRRESVTAFQKEWEFARGTTRLEAAIERPEVDAVLIASPSDAHAAQAAAALRAGKHVLVEIPIAMSQTDAERVAQVASETGRVLMVAHTQRFMPALVEARRRIVAGDLAVRHVVCRWFFYRRENVNWEGRRRSWTDNLLWHHSCHVVDAVLWLLGDADRAAGAGIAAPPARNLHAQASPPHPDLSIPLDLDLAWESPAGPLVQIAMSYNSHRAVHDYLLIGDQETLLLSGGRLLDAEDRPLAPLEGAGVDPIREQDREFLVSVREGRPPAVGARDVLPAMTLLQAADDRIAGRTR
jgi:2-hydroxy-4-carboxymuconate semialdehyde hemiacetal dehydrogenase